MNAPEYIHIAGLLVHAKPESLDSVTDLLVQHRAARIVKADVPGKCAAVLECGSERELGRCIDELQALAGVISVSMTSHFIEDLHAVEELSA